MATDLEDKEIDISEGFWLKLAVWCFLLLFFNT